MLDIADFRGALSIRIPTAAAKQSWKLEETEEHFLKSIFEETSNTDEPSESRSTLFQNVPNPDIHHHLKIIHKMLNDRTVPRADVWNFFVEHFENVGAMRPVFFPIVTTALFDDIRLAIKKAWEKTGELGALPSMTTVAKTYAGLGLMAHKDWIVVLRDVLLELVRRRNKESLARRTKIEGVLGQRKAEYNAPDYEPSIERVVADLSGVRKPQNLFGRRRAEENAPDYEPSMERVMADLIGVWKLFCVQYQIVQTSDPTGWSHLPSINPPYLKIKNMLHDRSESIGRAMHAVASALFPGYPSVLQRQPLAYTIILTYGLLARPAKGRNASERFLIWGTDPSPLLDVFGKVIGRAWTKRLDVKNQICHYLGITNGNSRNALWNWITGSVQDTDAPEKVTSYLPPNILRRSKMNRDIERIDALYTARTMSEKYGLTPGQALRFHHHFLQAYITGHSYERAVAVWNNMIQAGLTPQILAWNSMLEACRKARDCQALEQVWMMLRASGEQLNDRSWTTMILGLIDGSSAYPNSENIQKAMRLLEEMGRTWAEGEKKASPRKKTDAVKPTEHLIQCVMGRLNGKRHHDLALRIAMWGRQFGCKNTIPVYSMLLARCIRLGRPEEAQGILQDMQKDGVRPNVVIFSTVMTEAFREFSSFTPEQRAASLETIFSEMQKAGVEPDMFFYGKIIFYLIQDARINGDVSLVENVLHRMTDQGLFPNHVILTTLLDFYFARDPPDRAAIQETIRLMETSKNYEHVFWERVIQGYTHIGDMTSALKYYGKYNKEGTLMKWATLCKLLNGLVRYGQMETAMQLVREVRRSRGPPPEEFDKGQLGQHHFWMMVKDLE